MKHVVTPVDFDRYLDIYRVRQNKVAPSIFCGFLSNRLEFQCKIFHTYLVIICAFNSRISI